MKDVLDIAQVVRLTGLSSRTLRFYETRGLVAPLRTDSGRRLYGRAELERINRIVALKRAGLTLAQIRRATTERQVDLVELIDEQLRALEARGREIERARSLLIEAVIRLDPGASPDVEALCALVRQGVERNARAVERMPEVFEGLDIAGIKDRSAELAHRIEAAMPIDPASREAQALLEEVERVFVPYFAWWKARGAEVPAGEAGIPSRMDQWPGWPRFSAKIWQFIFAAGRHRPQVDR